MTEEDAKTKWCPFSRMEGGYSTFNRGDDHEIPASALCIASSCMAWRWGQTAGEGPFKLDYGTGYCGLAGKVN